eukprot:scaffold151488_cov33-Tisochrysis_lutea.AAC.6
MVAWLECSYLWVTRAVARAYPGGRGAFSWALRGRGVGHGTNRPSATGWAVGAEGERGERRALHDPIL